MVKRSLKEKYPNNPYPMFFLMSYFLIKFVHIWIFYIIKNFSPKDKEYAKELIQIVMKKYGIGKEYNSTYNYASQFPFEDNDTLVQKGLIRLKKMTKK